MEENKELQEQVHIPEALSDALFHPKITGKQRKFALLLVHSEGLHTATHCAIQAGYAKDSAVVRASELQHRKNILWLQKLLNRKGELLLRDINAHKKGPYLHWHALEIKRLSQGTGTLP